MLLRVTRAKNNMMTIHDNSIMFIHFLLSRCESDFRLPHRHCLGVPCLLLPQAFDHGATLLLLQEFIFGHDQHWQHRDYIKVLKILQWPTLHHFVGAQTKLQTLSSTRKPNLWRQMNCSIGIIHRAGHYQQTWETNGLL